MYSITISFSYKFKTVNNIKEKPSTTGKLMVETKTARYLHDIELYITEKEKRTQTRKLKRFLSKSIGCRVVKSTTGPQWKLTSNTIDLLTDHIRSIFCHN